MDSLVLTCSFAAAMIISACVVLLFSRPIDEALARVVPAPVMSAWSNCVKFGLFTLTLVGGLRLSDMAVLVSQRSPSGDLNLGAGSGLLEVFRTIAGSLVTAAGALLAFFAVTLAVDALSDAYRAYKIAAERRALAQPKPAPAAAPAPAKPSVPAARPQVGAERHAASRERDEATKRRMHESDRHAERQPAADKHPAPHRPADIPL